MWKFIDRHVEYMNISLGWELLAHGFLVYYAFSGCSCWSDGARRCVSVPYGSPEKSG